MRHILLACSLFLSSIAPASVSAEPPTKVVSPPCELGRSEMTSEIRFHEVLGVAASGAELDGPEESHVYPGLPHGDSGSLSYYLVHDANSIGAEMISWVKVMDLENEGPSICVDLSSDGAGRMCEFSERLRGKQMALVVQSVVIWASIIERRFCSRVEMQTGLTTEESCRLVERMRAREPGASASPSPR